MTDDNKTKDIPSLTPRSDYEMNVRPGNSSKVMMVATITIMIVALAGGLIAVAPKVRNDAAQEKQIADLRAEVERMRLQETQKQENSPVAPEVESRLESLQSKLEFLAQQAGQFQSAETAAQIQSKLGQLETQFNSVVAQSKTMGLAGMMARVQNLQQTPEGAKIIEGIVGSLAGASATGDVNQDFEALRASDPAVAEVTQGVAPEDMKAAAMLIAMAQMRKSLQRNNDSFDEDLALLKKTLPEGSDGLAAAIDRLAPQARYGVLTPDGLSQELRGVTGEIVSASLSGADVSMGEKIKTRMSDVLLVEKNGQRISGNETQIAVAAAQKQLDAGNVAEAVKILETVQGPASQKTQPLIEKAQATLMAGDLQSMLSQSVVQNIKASVSGMVNGMPAGVVNGGGISGITNTIKNYVPGAQGLTPAAPAPIQQP